MFKVEEQPLRVAKKYQIRKYILINPILRLCTTKTEFGFLRYFRNIRVGFI